MSDNQTGRVAGAFTLPSNSDIAILFAGAFDHTIAGGGKADINKCPLMTERGQPVLKALFASAPIAEDVVSSQPCSLLNPAPRTCRWPISGVG